LQTIDYSLSQTIRSKQFWMMCTILICNAFCSFTVMIHIVLHARGLGISAVNAANILVIIGGVSLASTVIIGSIADRIGYKLAYTICFIVNSVAFFGLIAVEEAWILYPFAVIFGIGWGGARTVMSPLVAQLFGLGSLGTILGGLHFSATIGAAIGPLLAGGIFDITNSYQPAWLVCGILMTICVIITLLLKPPAGKEVINDPR
jgi:MFS family permease